MIKQISWETYWSAISTALILYYVVICYMYYLTDIKKAVASKSKRFFKKAFSNAVNLENKIVSHSHEELFPVLNQLAQEIKMMIEDALQKCLVKKEILYAVQILLKKYPMIKGTPFEPIVTGYILTECLNYCSIHLDEAEVNMLWMD